MSASPLVTVICTAAVLFALSGCGQKGPLFMPQKVSAPPVAGPDTAPVVTPAPVTPNSPAMTPPAGAVVPTNR